jgi:hypothetical protein
MEKTLQMIKDKQIPIVEGPLEIENFAKWIYCPVQKLFGET